MSNETNNIDQLFKSKLRDYSVEAPEHVWKGIEASRTPLHRAINFFKSKRGAALGSFIALATISSIAYFTMSDTEQLAQQSTTAYSIQKYNNSASVFAANYTDASKATTVTTVSNTQNQLSNTSNNNTPDNSETTFTNTATNNNSNTQSIDNSSTTNTPEVPPANNSQNDNNSLAENNGATKGNKEDNSTTKEKETLLTTNNSSTDKEVGEAPITNKDEILTASIDAKDSEGTEKTEESNKNNKVTVKPKNLISKWSADVYAGGNFAMRSLTANGVDNNYFEAKKGAESYLPGYTFGARLNYDVNPFLTVRSGVNYSRLSQRLNFERSYEYTEIETVTGVILDPVTQQPIGTTTRTDTNTYTETARANTTNAISFIDIPVQLELNVYKTPKYSVFATAGASLNLRFTQKGHQINQRLTGVDEISTNNPFRTTAGMSILGGVGFKYNLNSNFSLLMESTYQHGVTNVMKNEAGMRQSYRIINATVGLRYRF